FPLASEVTNCKRDPARLRTATGRVCWSAERDGSSGGLRRPGESPGARAVTVSGPRASALNQARLLSRDPRVMSGDALPLAISCLPPGVREALVCIEWLAGGILSLANEGAGDNGGITEHGDFHVRVVNAAPSV